MDRIKEGIIVVDGIELNGDTTVEDLRKIEIDKGALVDHPRGFTEVVFNHPIVSDGVEFQVSMRIDKNEKHKAILLNPKERKPVHGAINNTREDQEISEEWLKRNMGVEPTRDTDEGIFYDFPWGHVYSSAAEHINFGGPLQGGIFVLYGPGLD